MSRKQISFLRNALAVAALAAGSVFTAGCPVSNTAQEKSFSMREPNVLPSATPTASGTIPVYTDSRSWRTPAQIDHTAVTAPSPAATPFGTGAGVNHGHQGALLGHYYPVPLAGVFSSTGQPYAAMVAFDATDSSNTLWRSVIARAASFDSDTWHGSTSFETFEHVGAGLVADVGDAPAGKVTTWTDFYLDALGRIHYFFAFHPTDSGAPRHLYTASRLSSDVVTKTWDDGFVPVEMSTSGTLNVASGVNDLSCTPRIAGSSDAELVALWCGSDQATDTFLGHYYNLYSSGSGWTSPVLLSATTTYFGVSFDTALSSGGDVSVNASGQGWAVYPMSTAASGACTPLTEYTGLILRQYSSGSGFSATATPLTYHICGGLNEQYLYPKAWTRSDGSFSVFYYRYDGAEYAFYRVDGDATGSVGAPVRLDDSTIVTSTLDYSGGLDASVAQKLQPQLAFYGDYALVLYRKSNGSIDRLYASVYSPDTGWGASYVVDDSLTYGVGSYSVAAGPDYWSTSHAQFVIAYEGLSSGFEPTSVYGRIYSSYRGGISAQTLLDSAADETDARPKAITGAGGKAAVLFFAKDGAVRKAYSAGFR